MLNFSNNIELSKLVSGASFSNVGVVDILEQQVAKTPNRPALVIGEEKLTYDNVDRLSNRLADYLVNRSGLKPGQPAAVDLPRGKWMLIALLAITKAGGVYHFTINRGNERPFPVQESQDGLFIDAEYIKTYRKQEESCSDEPLAVLPGPSMLLLAGYRPGSQGFEPDTTMSHQQMVKYLYWARHYFLGKNGRFDTAFFSVLSHYTAFNGIFLCLMSGGTLHIAPEGTWLTTLQWVLSRPGIGYLGLTPTQVQMIDPLCSTTAANFIITGEVLPGILIEKLRKINPAARIFNIYGLSEMGVPCSLFEVKSAWCTTGKNVPIGQSTEEWQILILDRQGRHVLTGAAGQVYIMGVVPSVENHSSDLRKLKLQNWNEPARRPPLFNTGDLARQLPDGHIQLLGKSDEQEQLYHQPVDGSRIIATLLECEQVAQCALQCTKDDKQNKVLAGFIVSRGSFDAEVLKQYLRSRLPEYQIPSFLLPVEELPLREDGRLDRETLRALSHQLSLQRNWAHTRSELEDQLVRIWSIVLNVESTDIHHNLLELGGDPRSASVLATQINRFFSVALTAADLLAYPSVRQLADYIRALLKDRPAQPVVDATHSRPESLVVQFSEAKNKPLLFCMPGISGMADTFFELSYLIGKKYGIYAFQSPGLKGESPPLSAVEDIAAIFIKEMRKIDPHGPYNLVGYSYGATLTYEMAYQLELAGFCVSKLIILDTVAPQKTSSQEQEHISFAQGLVIWAQFYAQSFNRQLTVDGLKWQDKNLIQLYDHLYRRLTAIDIQISRAELKYLSDIWIYNHYASRNYQPQARPLLRAPVFLLANRDEDYRWEACTEGAVEVIKIHSNHFEMMMQPDVHQVADALGNHICW